MLLSRLIVPAILATLCAGPALAHELWIEPLEYQVDAGEPIRAELRNGQNFVGIALPYLPDGTARLEIVAAAPEAAPRPLAPRLGDRPAISVTGEAGLAVLIYQSAPVTLRYDEREKFDAFVAHKDLGEVGRLHAERGLPETGFSEVYTRFSKALVAVGDGKGADLPLGLETELVALANPYEAPGTLPVQLFYLGQPRVDAQIEVFERSPAGQVRSFMLRTDAGGRAEVPVRAGHDYMLDAVVLREPAPALAEETGAVWESLWANLVFAIPG